MTTTADALDLAPVFAKLTPAQHRMMMFQGTQGRFVPGSRAARTGRVLVRLGLAVERRYSRAGMQIGDVGFDVPIPIHMAYCEWCSLAERAEENAG